MGIYPSQPKYEFATDKANGNIMHKTWDNAYGEVIVETWIKICEIRDRYACWCCSCGDREGSDPYCRNHGFAGTRPCEQHGMEGAMVHPEDWDEEGPPHMPESVQKARARWESVKTQTEEGNRG